MKDEVLACVTAFHSVSLKIILSQYAVDYGSLSWLPKTLMYKAASVAMLSIHPETPPRPLAQGLKFDPRTAQYRLAGT